MHDEFRRVIDPLRFAPQRAHAVDGEWVTDPGQRQVWPKGSALELAAKRLEGDLDVMVQELEPGFLTHPHPYDTSPTKVREGADSADGHEQFAVLNGGLGERFGQCVDTRFGLLAKKFEREMEAVLGRPADFRRALAERRGGSRDFALH